jgi:hypothetical protein
MKKQLIFIAILIASLFCYNVQGQVRVGVNIGIQPVWGPVGYDHVDYYYIPDIDAYYDVVNGVYVYYDGGSWITSRGLPPRYHDFDIYHAYKVVINDPRPWLHHDRYRAQYSGFRGRHDQGIIRDSHEPRYFENPNHPRHNEWHGEGHDHDDHGRH